MNLTSPSHVKAWCIGSGFHPNKVLGQNFLVDRNVLEAIVGAGLDGVAGDPPSVLEIGPGLGVMTEELLRRGCRVTAVEKDPVLAARLADALGRPAGLAVVEGDALAIVERGGMDFCSFDAMVSNLPYQAGTRMLLELAALRAPATMTVLVQTEVAERLAAREGSKMRGLAGAARLRRAHSAQSSGLLLLAEASGRVRRRAPRQARPQRRADRRRAPALQVDRQARVLPEKKATWQSVQRYGTIYGTGGGTRERGLDRPDERTQGK